MARAWRIGEKIDNRWEVHNILQGGAGVVYIVYDEKFRAPFAAKTYRDDVFEMAPEIGPRFMHEALAWVTLDVHPHITRAHMVESIDNKPFLFLEFVSGGDLRAWIGTPRLMDDLPQALRFALQFCDGMIHARSKGVLVHRDVKPQNCLITQDRALKITDFGLAKVFDEVEASKARQAFVAPGMTIEASMGGPEGTCTHMAPEQFADARRVDVRADVYSFGVMLYQMLAGELPFAGQSWEEMEQLHRTQPPPQLKGADPKLNSIVLTCLEKDPEKRFQDFERVREWLAEVYESKVGQPAPEPALGAELGPVEWNNKGSSLGMLGRHEEAVQCYDKALEQKPEFPEAMLNKGVALFSLGRAQEAVEWYDRALSLNANLEGAWTNKGVALKAAGQMAQAMTCYEKALKINPRYPDAWINKGVALRAFNLNDEAIPCYDRAIRLNPTDQRAWANKGNALYASGRHLEAIQCYDRALKINPRLDGAWLSKGMAHTVIGQADEALKCYDQAIGINPNLAQAWFNKGVVLVNIRKQYKEALPYLEQAERLGATQATDAIKQCKQLLGNA